MIDLVVAGEPKGKGRPQFVRATGRAYTPTATQRAEQRIQTEWIAQGRPAVDDGPLVLHVEVVIGRPQGHWKVDGSLGLAGLRSPCPLRKPDLDNAIKLVADALNGLAFRDDVMFVEMRGVKRWALRGEREHTRIRVAPADVGFGT